MKRNAILATLAAALFVAVGCIPVAHVELEDGSWVSFVGPAEMPYPATGPYRTTADGRIVQTANAVCTASRDVGLQGTLTETKWEKSGATEEKPFEILRTLTLRNVSDKPIALKRFATYGHLGGERLPKPAADGSLWRSNVTCDPAKGFVIPEMFGEGSRTTVVAETPGFTHRLILLARPWRLEGDTVVYPFPFMKAKPQGRPLPIELPDWLAAEGAEVVARPFGGGKPFATARFIESKRGFRRYEIADVPPMFPLELVFRAAPGAKDRTPTEPQWDRGLRLASGAPVFALAGEKPLNVTLAPGETLAFTMRVDNASLPRRGDTRH